MNMDLLVFVQHQSISVKRRIYDFFHNIVKLLRASPVFGGAVVGTGIILGFCPILLWQYFGKFIDGCFGSRGVGTMTSDLTNSSYVVGLLGVLLVVAGVYFVQTKALSRTIASTIAVSAILITHLVALLPIEKSFMIFLAIIAVGFHFAKHRAVAILMNLVLLLLSVSAISDILAMMTHRSLTVGTAIEYCFVVLTLSAVSAIAMQRR